MFNQSKLLWNGLEDCVLEHARTQRQRLSVLTVPVLADDDRVYRGVQLPRRFWKIAAWAAPASRTDQAAGVVDDAVVVLAATGYLLNQSPQLQELEQQPARARAVDEAPTLGPFRSFQVPIADLAGLTGLDLGPLPAADQLAAVPVAAAREQPAGSRWGGGRCGPRATCGSARRCSGPPRSLRDWQGVPR